MNGSSGTTTNQSMTKNHEQQQQQQQSMNIIKDETFKKLLFVAREYKKMRSELERISHITIQQQEQMKYQQFTIENMQLYITKLQQEIIELKSQVRMERELCEDAIRLQQKQQQQQQKQKQKQKQRKLNSSSPSSLGLGLGNGDFDYDDDDDSNNNNNHDETRENMMKELMISDPKQYYHLLLTGNEEGDDSVVKFDKQLSSSSSEDKQRQLSLEDEASDLKRENHELRAELMKLKEDLYSMKQLQKHQRTSSDDSSSSISDLDLIRKE